MTQNRTLAEVEALYGGLIATLPAIVYVAEPLPPYATIYVSPSIASLGFDHQAWVQDPEGWVKCLHPEDREWVLAESEAALAANRAFDFEYRILDGEGQLRWIHDRSMWVFDAQGEPLCWQGVLLDITRRRRAEEERETLIAELRAALGEISTLSRLLPVCSYCKRVRDDRDYWHELDAYLAHAGARITHGICPDCYRDVALRELEEHVSPGGEEEKE
ncbi:MAG TPA: PAS domain-containing protein [Thermoanaerobaculia bacterium]|jgi:PAS domain S-box-containing protein|nr:PAS domain-containing protein [Thermoanaerobaculia bacterium]